MHFLNLVIYFLAWYHIFTQVFVWSLIFSTDYHIFQYFIQVVPTEVRTYAASVDTYQFAVTERVSLF